MKKFHKQYKEKLCIDCKEREGTYRPYWAGLGFDRFHDIAMPELTPAWENMSASRIFRWQRCHGIFRENELNRPRWRDFKDQKKCFDIILGAGMRPVLEISMIPQQFRNPDHPLGFCGNMKGWHDYIKTFITFLLKTYGLDEVKNWYFEFWNEPDHNFWAIDQQQLNWEGITCRQKITDYCTMYDWTVQAIKDIDSTLKVGGPALTGDTLFLKEFMNHCLEGKNAVTNNISVPLDFISFHMYSNSPDRYPCMMNLQGRLIEIDRLINKYSKGRSLEKILSEWGMTWGGWKQYPEFPIEYRNNLHSAAFTLKLIKETQNLNLSAMTYWGFSEWTWQKRTPDKGDFNGFRALLTYSGIEKPVMAAYRLLNNLIGKERCHVHRMVDTNNVDALSALDDSTLFVVFWHHDIDPHHHNYPSTTEIIVKNLPVDSVDARLKIAGYTVEHNTYAEWLRMEKPAIPSKKQTVKIQEYAHPLTIREKSVHIQNNSFVSGEMTIRPGECFLLTIEW